MQIVKTERFDEELEDIVDFIAKDNINQALIFFDEIISKIESVVDFLMGVVVSRLSHSCLCYNTHTQRKETICNF